MASDKKSPKKQIKFLLWTALFLLLLTSGSLFFAAKNEVSGENIPQALHSSHTVITPTPTILPTTTLTPTLTPLFFENFVDNKKGWFVGDAAGYMRTISYGRLTLADINHKILTESLPSTTTFSDYIFTMTFTILKADEHDSIGVYLRGDTNLDNDYRIDISGNGNYTISKESLDESKTDTRTTLVGPLPCPALLSVGHQNTLTVIINGPALELLMNGQMVTTLTEADYTHGQIALFVENGYSSDAVTATFSSILVQPILPQIVPEPTPSVTPGS